LYEFVLKENEDSKYTDSNAFAQGKKCKFFATCVTNCSRDKNPVFKAKQLVPEADNKRMI
jgi:hypothetical protein